MSKTEERTVVGTLDDLLGHDGPAGRLYEADGTVWECEFEEGREAELAAAWRRRVRVTGEATDEPERRTLRVQGAVAPVDVAESEYLYGSFWEPLSIEELARRQGVKPIEDVDAWLASLPAIPEEEASGFYEFILESRRERREADRRRESHK